MSNFSYLPSPIYCRAANVSLLRLSFRAGPGTSLSVLDSRFRGNDDFGMNAKKHWGRYPTVLSESCRRSSSPSRVTEKPDRGWAPQHRGEAPARSLTEIGRAHV